MKLIKAYIWNAEAFQCVQHTYLLVCLLTAAQAKNSTTIWSHCNNKNKTQSVSVFIWESKPSSLLTYTPQTRIENEIFFFFPVQLMNQLSFKIVCRNFSSRELFPLKDSPPHSSTEELTHRTSYINVKVNCHKLKNNICLGLFFLPVMKFDEMF